MPVKHPALVTAGMLLVFGFALGSGTALIAQEQPSNQMPSPDEDAPKAATSTDNAMFEKARELYERSWKARFSRAFEYDFQRVEQPAYLITGTGTLAPNPEHYLNEHTLKFQFSEVFPSASTLATAFKSACTLAKNAYDCTYQPERADRVRRIASSGGVWQRGLSGVTLTVNLSERTALQQGIVVANPSFANHYQVTGGVNFDPSQLFLNGTNWSKAAAAFSDAHAVCDDRKQDGKDSDRPRNCVADVSRPRLAAGYAESHRLATAFLAAVVPTISFKRVSQFDFVKNGGVLVPAPFLENAQTQLTFKWDLKKAIPSTSMMLDATVATAKPPSASRVCIIVNKLGSTAFPVKDDFQASACAEFAKSLPAKYRLACVRDKEITQGSDRDGAASVESLSDAETCWNKPSGPR